MNDAVPLGDDANTAYPPGMRKVILDIACHTMAEESTGLALG